MWGHLAGPYKEKTMSGLFRLARLRLALGIALISWITNQWKVLGRGVCVYRTSTHTYNLTNLALWGPSKWTKSVLFEAKIRTNRSFLLFTKVRLGCKHSITYVRGRACKISVSSTVTPMFSFSKEFLSRSECPHFRNANTWRSKQRELPIYGGWTLNDFLLHIHFVPRSGIRPVTKDVRSVDILHILFTLDTL